MQNNDYEKLAKALDSEIGKLPAFEEFLKEEDVNNVDRLFIEFTTNLKQLLNYYSFKEIKNYNFYPFSGVNFCPKIGLHFMIGDFGREEIHKYCRNGVREKDVVNENLRCAIGIGFNLKDFQYEKHPSIAIYYENDHSIILTSPHS